MKIGTRLPAAALLLTAPLAAYADTVPGTGVLYAFGGGFFGGLIGALLACWLCKRGRGPREQTDTKKY